MVARRYEFYFLVAKQYFTNERSEWVEYCFCHEKIKFISLRSRVMFFLLYRQKDIYKIKEGNYRNYVIDDYEKKTMNFMSGILRVVYFPVKHSCLYNKEKYFTYVNLALLLLFLSTHGLNSWSFYYTVLWLVVCSVLFSYIRRSKPGNCVTPCAPQRNPQSSLTSKTYK